MHQLRFMLDNTNTKPLSAVGVGAKRLMTFVERRFGKKPKYWALINCKDLTLEDSSHGWPEDRWLSDHLRGKYIALRTFESRADYVVWNGQE